MTDRSMKSSWSSGQGRPSALHDTHLRHFQGRGERQHRGAQQKVGDGQVDDEVVGGGAKMRVDENGEQDHDVADDGAQHDGGQDQPRQHGPHQRPLLLTVPSPLPLPAAGVGKQPGQRDIVRYVIRIDHCACFAFFFQG